MTRHETAQHVAAIIDEEDIVNQATSKGAQRAARKARVAAGLSWRNDLSLRTRTPGEEARHQRCIARWARRYDTLNGAPEASDDC